MNLPKTLFSSLLFMMYSTCSFASHSHHDWEHWDEEQIAEIIDTYWIGSPFELNHRKKLARLVSQVYLPNESFLEIGCGSGLVYGQLVPAVMANECYCGIDSSYNMLQMASERYPKGLFSYNDAYSLSFADSSVPIVAAFEVLGHIPSVEIPIREMFRVASRLVMFTTWYGPRTIEAREQVADASFIHTVFSKKDMLSIIEKAIRAPHKVHIVDLSEETCAYLIYKL